MDNKKHFKIFAVVAALLMFLSHGLFIHGRGPQGGNVIIPDTTVALVVEVIDINAIRVELPNGDQGLVRLIGIAPGGTPEAIRHLSRMIMGDYVVLMRDDNVPNRGRWNYMYVYHGWQQDFQLVNARMVLSGYARMHEGHDISQFNENFAQVENIARSVGLGMWGPDLVPVIGRLDPGRRININTATAEILVYLLDIPAALADAMVAARQFTVFQHTDDAKFVHGMTRHIFSANRLLMTVSTNVNTAPISEIATLYGMTTEDAQLFVNSRAVAPFSNLNDIANRGLMTIPQLNANLPFMSIDSIEQIPFARPNFRANINTANHQQLTRAGIPPLLATQIIAQRAHNIPYRHISDLTGFGLDIGQINNIADNIRARTNINLAPLSEIESLFGNNLPQVNISGLMNNRPFNSEMALLTFLDNQAIFDSIQPFIYFNENNPPHVVNINRASSADLIIIGFGENLASSLTVPWRPPMTLPSHVPAAIPANLRPYISLFTNINNATVQELQSLDSSMMIGIVNNLLLYTREQPFGSMEELREFFIGIGHEDIFERIAPFVVLR